MDKVSLAHYVSNVGKTVFMPPISSTNDGVDDLLHEYYVCSQLEKMFGSRADKAKDALKDSFSNTIENLKTNTQKNETGSIESLPFSSYTLVLETKKAATRLDSGKLAKELINAGVSPAVVAACIKAATVTNAVPVTIRVSENK